jgi:hypothetical protein
MREALSEMNTSDILTAGIDLNFPTDTGRSQMALNDTDEKPWPQYLVWGVLILGAMLLSRMAWSLIGRSDKK